jgi:two-component system cell cycle sensor histidine kinase/response regulator CckA
MPATILIAEDQLINLWLLCLFLEAQGYQVLRARNGTEALQLAESHDGAIDLLLTDICMPEMDGYRLAAEFRKKRPEAKVMFITAQPRHLVPSDIPVVLKPFDPEDLLAAVRQILAG